MYFKYNKKLHELNYQKILIEGGAKTASSFLNKGYCDFMYIYKAKSFVEVRDYMLLIN